MKVKAHKSMRVQYAHIFILQASANNPRRVK